MTPFKLFESADAKRKRHLENQLALLPELTNRYRASQGLGPMRVHPWLMQSAQAKADDMASKSYYSHNPPGGIPWAEFVKATGYPLAGSAAENLLEIDQELSTAQDWVNAWASSPEQRENMVIHWEDFGVGVSIQERLGLVRVRVVQHFGTRIG